MKMFYVMIALMFVVVGCKGKADKPRGESLKKSEAVSEQRMEMEKVKLAEKEKKIATHNLRIKKIMADNDKAPANLIKGRVVVVTELLNDGIDHFATVKNCDEVGQPQIVTKNNGNDKEVAHCSCRTYLGAIAEGMGELDQKALIRYTRDQSSDWLNECPDNSLIFVDKQRFLNAMNPNSKLLQIFQGQDQKENWKQAEKAEESKRIEFVKQFLKKK